MKQKQRTPTLLTVSAENTVGKIINYEEHSKREKNCEFVKIEGSYTKINN
jgi:hypothetical protein